MGKEEAISLNVQAETIDFELVPSIRVILSDPDPLAREGIHKLLSREQHVQVVGVTADMDSLMNMLIDSPVDAVLVDISLIEDNDFLPLTTLRHLYPKYRIVAVGTATRSDIILKALRLGVGGYVQKSGSIDRFQSALRLALGGKSPVLPDIAQQLLGHMIQETAASDSSPPMAPLSRREKEVLVCLTKGMSNKEIAEKLQVTNRTVKAHVSKVLLKMGVADRTQAVVKALGTDLHFIT